MKTQIALLFFILFLGKFSFAQFYFGADVTGAYPLGHLKSQVDFGYGPRLNVGYSLNEKLDISFSYELLNFKTMQPDFKIMSETLSAKYKFNMKKYNPYLGVRAGIYHSKVKVPSFFNGQTIETSQKKENAFGIAPIAGLIINTGNPEKLKFNISASYSTLKFKNNYQYLSLSFGVLYFL
ncbi:MAG: outer membrane beta-barrel protein [bacterium]